MRGIATQEKRGGGGASGYARDALDRVLDGGSGRARVLGFWGWDLVAAQVEFASTQEFPLDLFAGLEADGCRQRDGEVDVEFWVLSLGTDGLDFEEILG